MKISFIIPAYNEENYIFDCLQSIFGLDRLPDFSHEVIVVDNGSTDKTQEIIKRNFPNVKVIFEPQKGVTFARNRGGIEASGEILVFFDADVKPPKDWLKKVLRVFNDSEKVVAISGPYHYEDLNCVHQRFLVNGFYFIFPFLGEFLFEDLLGKGGILQGGNIVVKKSVFEKSGGFDERASFWGDEALFSKRLIKFGKIKFLNSLWVNSSARRLKKEGFIKTGCRGVVNCVWPMMFGKPFTKNYVDIRENLSKKTKIS